jgi:hypothetical protein
VRSEFALERNLDRLAAKFGVAVAVGAEAGTHAHRLLRSA